MDLKAVKAASRPEVAQCAIAATRNACGLLDDAELLARKGRKGRAYSLAVLAVEECGKAMDLTALAVMPDGLKRQAPVGRMLQSHQLKIVGGLLLAVLPLGSVSSTVASMPTAELDQILTILDTADESERLKRRGFYVDMDNDRRTREPSEISTADVESQLGRARQATASVTRALLEPQAQARLANPPADAVELVQDLVSTIREARHIGTPRAAAEVLLKTLGKFRDRRGTLQTAHAPR